MPTETLAITTQFSSSPPDSRSDYLSGNVTDEGEMWFCVWTFGSTGEGILLLSKTPRHVVGPTQPLNNGYGGSFPGGRAAGE